MDKVIKEMKTGKASGNEDITTEMLKALDETGLEKITEICNLIYDTGHIPNDLNESIIVRLPKKAKATNCSDFRTLSLMSHVMNLLLKVIFLRNRSKIEREINEALSGFITGKDTREGIFNLRTICKRYLECNKDV